MRRLQDWFAPHVKSDTDAHDPSANHSAVVPPPRAEVNHVTETVDLNATPGTKILDARATDVAGAEPVRTSHWLAHNILFVAMLGIALAGVILKLPVLYWIVVTPIFGLISFAAGWSHFHTRGERAGLAYRLAAIWFALLVCVASLYGGGIEGVMNLDASSSPAVMTLLALGTFVAGVQARVWQICGVGAALLVAGPAVAWLGQSPLLGGGGSVRAPCARRSLLVDQAQLKIGRAHRRVSRFRF
jgi:hypothetical protein